MKHVKGMETLCHKVLEEIENLKPIQRAPTDVNEQFRRGQTADDDVSLDKED